MKSQKKSVKICVIRVIRVLWNIWSRQRFTGISRQFEIFLLDKFGRV